MYDAVSAPVSLMVRGGLRGWVVLLWVGCVRVDYESGWVVLGWVALGVDQEG